MKAVVVHNRYRTAQPSGENRVVDADVAALRADGVDVVTYFRESDAISTMSTVERVGLAVRPSHSFVDVRELGTLLDRSRPDVVHVHNVYPLISPSVVRLAARRGVAVVQTVHNFRHRCVSGIGSRDGRECTECFDRRVAWPAVRHGCYQDSVVRSVPMAVAVSAHRSTWRLVDQFLACGDHVAAFLRDTGIDPDRIEVRRNTVPDPGEPSPLGDSVLFVGRLVEEKGVRVLLDAWARLGHRRGGVGLRVAGDGPLRDVVMAAAASDPSIAYLGLLDATDLAHEYRSARLVVVPSLWPEPDPMVVVSALAHGRPVVATAMGSVPITVGDDAGWLAEPTAPALADALGDALSDDRACAAAGTASRRRYLGSRRPGSVRPLVEVYADVLARRRDA